MATIFSPGKVAIQVDDEDFAFLSQFRWSVAVDHKNGLPYAYTQIFIEGRRRAWGMHRAVMKLAPGDSREVDHIRVLETLTNTGENLRFSTRSENNANRRLFRNNTSGYRGVYAAGAGRWYVVSWVGGKKKYLGTFDDPKFASEVFIAEKIKAFGRFARVE
jgi:hypothetical protein